MIDDHFHYRVYFPGNDREICEIEADAPIDPERMRRFAAKTVRTFHLADDAEVRIIEIRKVTERRDVTNDIFISEDAQEQKAWEEFVRRIREERKRREDSYSAIRNLFDGDDDQEAG